METVQVKNLFSLDRFITSGWPAPIISLSWGTTCRNCSVSLSFECQGVGSLSYPGQNRLEAAVWS
jgi:hypothetical protein